MQPLAAAFPDGDSIADPFLITAFALAAVERLGFVICCDLFLGAGEVRHIAPFGRRRSIGLKRLEDGIQVLQKLLKERSPVDHDGTVWTMRDAFIGNGGKDRAPQVIAMGGGPRLTDAALRFADGWSAGAPFVYASAERYGEVVRSHRVPPEMVRKTFFHGTPEEIAAEIRPFVEQAVAV